MFLFNMNFFGVFIVHMIGIRVDKIEKVEH